MNRTLKRLWLYVGGVEDWNTLPADDGNQKREDEDRSHDAQSLVDASFDGCA